ncbi:MAG TPA: VOC family protein [Methylomirabilota bacterium]|nr:VOC family protein [Methylomirabilota bacterium]
MRSVLFDHIAIAVPRLADAEAVLAGELGGRSAYGMTRGAFSFWHWRYEGGGDIEALEPAGDDGGFLHRFIAQRGPGIHHVTFTVPSLAEACERARRQGYSIVGYDDSDPEWSEAFLHPREAQGIVVQFAQTNAHHADVPPGHEAPASAPPGARDAASRITVLGLRLSARSRERAHTQWGTVVQGQLVNGSGGTLVYRWPGSFLRITVEVDENREEGPLCIEYSSRQPVPLSDGRHPVLGAVFKRRPAE